MEEKNPVEEFIERQTEECVPYLGTKAKELYEAYYKWAIIHKKCLCSNTRFGIEASKFLKKEKKQDGHYYMGIQFKSIKKPYTLENRIYDDLVEYYDGDIEEMWKTISNVYEKIYEGIKNKDIKPKYKKLEIKKKEWWEQ